MKDSSLLPPPLRGERYFRWRGGDVSRLEGLSDAAFAFAMTLLVVSLEIPRTFTEMQAALAQLPVFAVCFAMLLMCWYYHFLFHRRYGLEDFPTMVLNGLLLFVILFYVYPLKFLFTLLYGLVRGEGFRYVGADGESIARVDQGQTPELMITYGAGVIGIFALFALLNLYAYSKRDALELDAAERCASRGSIRGHLLSASIGILSCSIAAFGEDASRWAGLSYFLMAPAHFCNGYFTGRRVEELAGPAAER